MANTAYEIKPSGQGDTLGPDSQFSRLFYVELNNATDHPAVAIQLPGLVGNEAVPWGTPHPLHAYLLATRFTVDETLNQKQSPFRYRVRVDYLPAVSQSPIGIIQQGWNLTIDYATETQLRRFDLDSMPLGPYDYKVTPSDVFGPPEYWTSTPGGRLELARTGFVVDEPKEVFQPAGAFALTRQLPRPVGAGELQTVNGYITTVNKQPFLFGPGIVMFRTFRVSYAPPSGTVPQDGSPVGALDTTSNIELFFQWRNTGWQLDETEVFSYEGNTSVVLTHRQPTQDDPRTEVPVMRTRRLYHEMNFDALLSAFNV